MQKISNPELISDWKKFERLQKKKKFLEKIIEKEKEIKEIQSKIEENKAILTAKEDLELVSLAEGESILLKEKEKKLEKELEDLLNEGKPQSFPHSKAAPKDTAVIVEIRAGTGGEEAALFATDLFRMYSKYSASQGWKQRVLDSRPTELGGFKEIVFELKNSNVSSKMKYEGGVHRVQRIPVTEKGGRIHTSTTSVAVLPKPKPAEIKIKPEDLKIDFYRASGPGGAL